ncbi:MAG TPA: universal stress protein [Luteimonas sp.]|nr:universal stress protein [Luteimonas sp.]
MNILLAIDGSSASDRAARYVVQLASQLSQPPTLVLVNVSAPLLPQAVRKLGRKSTAEYYASNSEHAVRKARRILERAGLAHDEFFPVGDAAAEITRLADKHDVDLVVMGSRGQTALRSLILGSVATRVLALSKVPLTVIR